MLLAEHRETEKIILLIARNRISSPSLSDIEELEDGMAVISLLPGGKHIQSFLLHLLLVSAWLSAQSPGMIEIEPVDDTAPALIFCIALLILSFVISQSPRHGSLHRRHPCYRQGDHCRRSAPPATDIRVPPSDSTCTCSG